MVSSLRRARAGPQALGGQEGRLHLRGELSLRRWYSQSAFLSPALPQKPRVAASLAYFSGGKVCLGMDSFTTLGSFGA